VTTTLRRSVHTIAAGTVRDSCAIESTSRVTDGLRRSLRLRVTWGIMIRALVEGVVRETCQGEGRRLVPGTGDVLVRELTAVTIDELYARLRVSGRTDGGSVLRGSVR
jgi:hypothetical protein